eukprot:TRINITY_DN7230_c0_g1_i1.p1 TRINITY_DN7230_c0_g1~~TRINITY_DN7230_c0_g1_i1.p1  ORF type:complete len:271 (-),score=34.17 TRINITY_DN7230_c0_g1_i1:175-987(-)
MKSDNKMAKFLSPNAIHTTGREAFLQINALVEQIHQRGDGKITQNEMMIAVEKYGLKVSERVVKNMFMVIGDGNTIAKDDFSAILRHKAAQHPNYTLKEILRFAVGTGRRMSLELARTAKRIRENISLGAKGLDGLDGIESVIGGVCSGTDEQLTYNDYLKVFVQMDLHFPPEQLRALFKDLDEDNDGKIAVDDFADILKNQAAQYPHLSVSEIVEKTVLKYDRQGLTPLLAPPGRGARTRTRHFRRASKILSGWLDQRPSVDDIGEKVL